MSGCRVMRLDTRPWLRIAGAVAMVLCCLPLATGQGTQTPPSPTIGATAGPGGSDMLLPEDDNAPDLDPLGGANPDQGSEARSGGTLSGGVSIGDGEETIPIITKKPARLKDDMIIETFPLTDLSPAADDDADHDVDLNITGRAGMRYAIFVGPDRESPSILLAFGQLDGYGKVSVPVSLPDELFELTAAEIANWTVFVYRLDGDWSTVTSKDQLGAGPAGNGGESAMTVRSPLSGV
jgi:hypothetical protein